MDISKRLNGLDLCSGIGGNTLALREWVKTIAYCDFDKHAQSVLLSRMRSGDIEPAPIWDDLTTLSAEHIATKIDIIIAGFPCQTISVSGKGIGILTPEKAKAEGDERAAIFFHIMRLIREFKPSFVFLENVPAIRTRGLNIVLRELTEAGYDCRWTMLSAASIGAPHKRERWFLLAYPNSSALREQPGRISGSQREEALKPHGNGGQRELAGASREEDSVCDSSEPRLPHGRGSSLAINSEISQPKRSSGFTGWLQGQGSGWNSNNEAGSFWEVEPAIRRVADGISLRVDRLKRLGNSVVPKQAKEAFEILTGLKKTKRI